ncbi:uncharacterized protein LOC133379562 isoform X2 [Rhineura floridana]|uniref:uncharacterized protein LOC133379562 isoform X2 n=1 Tax=Rhineura floridana TaxID=261503 RepID=UPI002AC876E5|nr:uncharacterized protein LOC133379562 isoform X2 [Rhineura floridana]
MKLHLGQDRVLQDAKKTNYIHFCCTPSAQDPKVGRLRELLAGQGRGVRRVCVCASKGRKHVRVSRWKELQGGCSSFVRSVGQRSNTRTQRRKVIASIAPDTCKKRYCA